MKAKRIVTDAMFIALFTVLSLYSINTGNMKISLDSFPVIAGAALLGPADGLLIGLLGSFINQLLTYGLTPTTVLWIIPSGVRGLIVGLYSKKHSGDITRKQAWTITILSSLAVTALNTAVMYADSMIYGYYTFSYVFGMLVPRIVAGIIMAFITGALLPEILIRLKKIIGM